MRIFRGQVFLGNGEVSRRAAEALHQRLDDALINLGGLQQGGPDPRFPEEVELVAEMRTEIEEVIRDLASALLGREIVFTNVQPQPKDGAVVQRYWEERRAETLSKLDDYCVPYPSNCICTPQMLHHMAGCAAHHGAIYKPYVLVRAS